MNFYSVGKTKTQEMKLSLPEASFESTQESTFHVVKSKESKNNDDDDDEEEDGKSLNNSKKQSSSRSDKKSQINNDESLSSDHRNSNISDKPNKLIGTQELKQPNKNLETLSSTKGEHLLSKGILLSYNYILVNEIYSIQYSSHTYGFS